ncbi:hypothetical protein INR49_008558 [Caranx melampygus]|nr:hypothetical protein INR49_008558 [Caranx melampygus]
MLQSSSHPLPPPDPRSVGNWPYSQFEFRMVTGRPLVRVSGFTDRSSADNGLSENKASPQSA